MGSSVWGFGVAGITYTLFAVRLFQRGYRLTLRDRYRSAALAAVVCTAVWSVLEWAAYRTGIAALFLAGAVSDVARYGCWFGFMLLILQPQESRKPIKGMNWLRPLAIGLACSALLALFGAPARLVLLASMALPMLALILLEQVFRNIDQDALWSIKPLCLGLAAAFTFDLYLYSQAVLFNHPDTDAMGIRGFVHALIAPLLMLSMTRRVDWLARMRLSPSAAFHTATVLLAGIYLVFISGIGYYVRYFGGEWGHSIEQGLIFAGLVILLVLMLSGSARAKLRVLLGKHFFHYQFDYREEWLRFTRTLSTPESPNEMGQRVVRGLADMLESPAGGLWTRVRGESYFRQTARWNMAPTLQKEDAHSPLCQFIAHSGWVVNLDEFRDHPQRYGALQLPEWLPQLTQAWLVVPLLVNQELIGFCVLCSARTRMEVNWEVNDLLKTAGQQAASYLTQMQATEALLEARKFDAFNRMSAFVVHDLKNIVTQLALMMKNAKRLGDNPDFQADMLMTVENALERMRHMLLQLREGGAPPEPAWGVNLANVVRRIEAGVTARGKTLDVQLHEPVLTRCHEERLERIIGHLVQNALDATAAGGRVWITLDRLEGHARIAVGDSGQGMCQQFIQNHLFKPFQTTKQTGMGIGAYESFQYVRELGGTLEVNSALGQGTTITLLLPLFVPAQPSERQTLEYA